MPTAEAILLTFPEFSTPPANQATYVSLSDARTAEQVVWNDDADLRNLAVALLAAHMMAQVGLVGSGIGSAPGAVTSERIGSLGVSYAEPAGPSAEDDLGSTKYGRQLMELRRENIFAPRTTYDG